jgi:uncharacterized protein YqgC (DUF456 family)
MPVEPGLFYLDLFIKSVALTVMLVGLLVLPILPGLVIIWVAALGYGLASGFGTLGWIMFAFLTLLMLFGSIIDNVLMGMSAHKQGAPWWVVLLATLAAIVGTFLIPIPILGGILAGLLTLFGIEWLRCKDWRKALASLKGMLVGWGWAFVIRFIIGVIMIGLWLVWALVG